MKGIVEALRKGRLAAQELDRVDRVLLFLVFSGVLSVYTLTCARFVTGEDSGELIAAAYTLGVAHPPGYPLWTMLGRLFLFLPFPEPAFAVAFMSAFFGAATALVLALTVLRFSNAPGRRLLALSLALGFSFMRDQWSQAVIAEVYTLNSFLLALGIYLALRWWEEPSGKRLAALGLTLGLGLANHHTMLALGLGVAPFLLLQNGDWRQTSKRLAVFSGALIAGLLPYAYLPLAASRNPAMNWGNPQSWDAFVTHVTRGQYKAAAVDSPAPEQTLGRFQDQLAVLWDHALGQAAPLLILLGLLALLLMTKRRPLTGFLFLSVSLLSTLGIIWYTNFDLDYENVYVNRLFFVPAYLCCSLALVLELSDLSARLPRKVVLPAFAGFFLLGVAQPLISNFEACDYSDYRVVEDYSLALLAEAPNGSVVFPSADHATFPLIYQQHVKGHRPDIINADPYGYVDEHILARAGFDVEPLREEAERRGWKSAVLRHLVSQTSRPVLYTVKKGIPRIGGSSLEHAGLWYRLCRHEAEGGSWDPSLAWDGSHATKIRQDAEAGNLDFSALLVCADLAYSEARDRYREEDDFEEARNLLHHSRDLNLGSKEHLNNLGSAAAEASDFETAKRLFWQARYLDPDYEVAARNLAIVMRATSDWAPLVQVLNFLLEKDEEDPFVFRQFMAAMKGIEDWAGYVRYALRHAQLTGDADSAHSAGIVALNELGDRKLALRCLERALELNPGDQSAQMLVHQLTGKPLGQPNSQRANAPGRPGGTTPQPIAAGGITMPQLIRPTGNTFSWGQSVPNAPKPELPRPGLPSGGQRR